MRIYSAPVLAQVAQMKQVLEMNGIECHIQGEAATSEEATKLMDSMP